MPVTEIGDPRLQALFSANVPDDRDIRPTVRLPRKGPPPLAIAIALLLLALLLFSVLNSRRLSLAEPSARPGVQSGGALAFEPPPSLYVPPLPEPVAAREELAEEDVPELRAEAAPVPAPTVQPQPQIIYAPQPLPQTAPAPIPLQPPRVSSGPALVIDGGGAGAGAANGSLAAPSPLRSARVGSRTRASALANRSTTVPQGTLIPAVLETGFDSTQPGFARAIVSRDVHSFDGTNLLIPRGSRLIGEYRSEVARGQKRAIISWTRLIRPDGMTIEIDSPAVDTLGRGGVPASVNTHFFQRLGDALLQSTVGIGSAVAQRAVSGPVIVVPGSGQTTGPSVGSGSIIPTLTVPPGKSISVFVAHDLDFSTAGRTE